MSLICIFVSVIFAKLRMRFNANIYAHVQTVLEETTQRLIALN